MPRTTSPIAPDPASDPAGDASTFHTPEGASSDDSTFHSERASSGASSEPWSPLVGVHRTPPRGSSRPARTASKPGVPSQPAPNDPVPEGAGGGLRCIFFVRFDQRRGNVLEWAGPGGWVSWIALSPPSPSASLPLSLSASSLSPSCQRSAAHIYRRRAHLASAAVGRQSTALWFTIYR
jgi:hypothetical protein